MNKTATAQPDKTAGFLPLNQGILQRKCACGNHTISGGECADCAQKKMGLQRKLTIGASNDPLEQEADRIADQVMASPSHGAVSGTPVKVQRLSGNSSGQTAEVPASVERVLASPGRPLEPALRQDMEGRFGHDFSRVRVHTGGIAEQSVKEVSANAYTVGNNIVFGAGQYDPGAHKGKKLITHELTHVLQQGLSTDAFQSNSEHRENSGMGRNGNVMPIPSNALATSAPDPRPVFSQLIPATKQLVLQRQETAESSSRDSQFSELLATTRDLGAIARGEDPSRPSSRPRRFHQHHGGQSGIDTFAKVARRFPNIDQKIQQYATHFYGMHRRIEMVIGGSVQFRLSQTYTDYQNRLVAVVNSLRHLQQNPTASRLHRWYLATQQANGAAHRLLDQPPLFGRPDIELGRILLPAIRELAIEATELGRFVELERERERRAQERERRTEEQSSPESERDATHLLTAALHCYVQRNRTSMRARASFHTGPILDILRRYLGRDQAALTEFVQQLSVSDPVLSSEISLGGALVRALTERTFINDAVTALRSYVEGHRSELDTNPENHVTPIREILVSHLGSSSAVARQFLDGLRSADPELHAYVSLGGRTLAEFIARDRPILPSVGRALIHGLMGEWHPGTDTTGMSEAEREEAEAEDMASIGVSTGVSLVPVLDQISDARDLTAHAYFMISHDDEIRSPLRWVGLVFSLIGAIPTVGSAIKGLSQVLMREVSRHGYRAVARAYNLIERVLPGTFDALINMRRGLISGWEAIARQAQEIWIAFLSRGRGVLEHLIGLTTERLRQIEAIASRMMPEAFARARVLFEESFDAIINTVRRAGTGIAEGVPRFLANVRERFMSLSATGRMQLELERFEALERAAREAFERGDIPTAERLIHQLDELVSGAGRQADELAGTSPERVSFTEAVEVSPRISTSESTAERTIGEARRTATREIDELGNVSRPTRYGNHRLTVSRSGRLIRCSSCEEIAQQYRFILFGDPSRRIEVDPTFRIRLEELQNRATNAAASGDEVLRMEVVDELADFEDELRLADQLQTNLDEVTDTEIDTFGHSLTSGSAGEIESVAAPKRPGSTDRYVPSTDKLSLTRRQRAYGSRLIGRNWDSAWQQAWNDCANARSQNLLANVRQLWSKNTPADMKAARYLARHVLFRRWTERFWRRVRRNPTLYRRIRGAGLTFPRGGRAPYYTWPDGHTEVLTIEHLVRLSDDPTKSVDSTNFVFSLETENTVLLEGIRRIAGE